jgi:hypothetical protein
LGGADVAVAVVAVGRKLDEVNESITEVLAARCRRGSCSSF